MIFISYRRDDSLEFCRSMDAELRAYFGAETVFFDQTIERGAEWPTTIRGALNAARVVLFVIGPNWERARDDASGRRRLDIGGDWVREEILAALKRKRSGDNIHIVPVLLPNVAMPKYLYNKLASFPNYQAMAISNTGRPEDFDGLKAQLVRWNYVPTVLPPVATPRIGRTPKGLSHDEETDFLERMKEWKILETREPDAPGRFRRELHRVYEFRSFEEAFNFMIEVAEGVISVQDHHPRWQNTYNRVEIWLTTFNIGYKPSRRDVRLAEACEKVWSERQAALRSKPRLHGDG